MNTLSASPFTVVSIGDLVADLVFSIPSLPLEADRHQRAHHQQLEPGGAGNFLITGQRLGMKMIALGAVGLDLFGDQVVTILRQEGIDVSQVVQDQRTQSIPVLALVDDAGRHVFVGGAVNCPPIAMPVGWSGKLAEAQAVYINGFSLLDTQITEAALAALAIAHQRKLPVFFDPGPLFLQATPAQRHEALTRSTAVLLTEEEIMLVAEERPVAALIDEWLQLGSTLVCIKRGREGCRIYTANGTIEHPGFAVPVRDTTAAGDSFAAGFVYGFLQGWPLPEVATFANAVGGAAVQKLGSGRQAPTRAEVEAVLHAPLQSVTVSNSTEVSSAD